MKTVVAVPMKDASESKSRLADFLTCAQREKLALGLFARSQEFFSCHFPEFTRLVVTPSSNIAQIAAASGSQVLKEDAATGLNQAAAAAFHWAQGQGYERLLLVPADIPVWLLHEVQLLLVRGASSSVAIAGAHDGGTNALLIDLTKVRYFEFGYGVGSAKRHEQWCKVAGVSSIACSLPFISHDIDTVDDCLVFSQSLKAATQMRHES